MKSVFEIASSILYTLRHRRVIRFTRLLSSQQWRSFNSIQHTGDKLADSLVKHAVKNVPYYRDLFRSVDLNPAVMDVTDDWNLIPVLNKETLRSRNEELVSTTYHGKRSMITYSGGSTGTPVHFLTDLVLCDLMEAFFRFVFAWAGWRPGEMVLHLWGGQNSEPVMTGWEHLRTLVGRKAMISFYSYDETSFMRWWKALNSLSPTILYTYPSVVSDFAKWLKEKGYRPKGLKGVFCSAEILFPDQRKIIEEIFGCKVFNQYGSRETPCVACECPHGNMHMFPDLNKVEFIDQPEGGNALKRLIVTPLFNFSQPLLRYDLGDLGLPKPGKCLCGRGYPLMELDVGRHNDHLVSPDNRQIYPSFFHHLFDGKDWIKCFQVRQTKIDKLILTLEIDCGPGNDSQIAELKKEISPRVNTLMGLDMNLKIDIVPNIERTASGKHRFIINEITDLS